MQTRAFEHYLHYPIDDEALYLQSCSTSIVLVCDELQRERNLSTLCLHHKCQN